MKIALTGAHGTGKTTAAHELYVEFKKKSQNVGIIEELARSCPFTLNPNVSPIENYPTSYWLLLEIQQQEMLMQTKKQIIICDRCIIDQFIYPKCIMGESIPKIFYSTTKYWLEYHPYDYIFHFPIQDGYLIADGVRDTNIDFQKKIDDELIMFLQNESINFKTVPKLEPVKFIMETINNY